MGDPYQCYQPISLHQLLAVVVFSLITSCQYANKLPRLFSILWLHCKIYDRNDDFFYQCISLWLANVLCVQFYCYFLVPHAVVCSLVMCLLTCMSPTWVTLKYYGLYAGKGWIDETFLFIYFLKNAALLPKYLKKFLKNIAPSLSPSRGHVLQRESFWDVNGIVWNITLGFICNLYTIVWRMFSTKWFWILC